MAVQEECIVKVWRAQPDGVSAVQSRALARLLDADEQAQAECLRFAADRRAYVLAHGLRRLALAHLLNLPMAGASALRFGHDAAGRPFLLHGNLHGNSQGAAKPNASPWFFSHAHSREGVIFAACREHPIGIDVEPEARRSPDPGLLRRYLHWPQQLHAGQEGLNWDSPSGFAQGWTALEAFVKALGCGLTGLSAAPVHCATLSLRNAGPQPLRMGLRALPRRHTCREALVLRPLAPPGCAAALAVRQGRHAPPPRLDQYRLDTDAALLGRLC